MIKHNNFDIGFKEKRLVFDTLIVYPDAGTGGTTVDGVVADTTADQTWANKIISAGDSAGPEWASGSAVYIRSGTTDTWSQLYRGITLFDTSGLSGTVPDSVVLSLYISSKSDDNSIEPDINIYSSNPASNNNLVAGDFDSLGTTAFSTTIAYNSVSIGYNNFSMNASGLSAIEPSSITKYGIRNANYDVAEIAPAWTGAVLISSITIKFADTSGTTSDPKLTIEYTAGGGFNSLFFGSTL